MFLSASPSALARPVSSTGKGGMSGAPRVARNSGGGRVGGRDGGDSLAEEHDAGVVRVHLAVAGAGARAAGAVLRCRAR